MMSGLWSSAADHDPVLTSEKYCQTPAYLFMTDTKELAYAFIQEKLFQYPAVWLAK